MLLQQGRLNFLTLDAVDALSAYFGALPQRPEVRLVELVAEGQNFCVGMDLKQPIDAVGDGPAYRIFSMKRFGGVVLNMRRAPQPILVGIRGAASGGGLCIALAADLRVADSSAKFNTGVMKIGLSGAELGLSYLLPRIIGAGAAWDMAFTGRTVEAAEALNLGLVSRLAEPSLLEDCIAATSSQILASSNFGLHVTKDAMWIGLTANSLETAMELEARNQALAFLTGDAAEGRDAFLAKRAPRFSAKRWQ